MNKKTFLTKAIRCAIVIICLLLPAAGNASMFHPEKPDAAKKCAVCHYQWVYTFYNEHRDGELAPLPKQKQVASEEMCFSCHDGSVADSRDAVFHGPGHRTGTVPSEKVSIPEDFPLDTAGRLQCATCHTPHAVSSKGAEDDDEVRVFLRGTNKGSRLCMTCHGVKAGGPGHGNHSINVAAADRPRAITGRGGRFGESSKNQVICQTCHVAHGSLNSKFLVLAAEEASRSALCVSCHGEHPGQSGGGGHPVNVIPERCRVPLRWPDGTKVAAGRYGELVCITCHRPHDAVDKKALLAVPNHKDSLCMECHRDKRFVAGSRHDLKTVAPEERNIKGQRAAGLGPCSSCHLPHGGKGKLMWARKTPIEHKPGEFCLSCHASGEVGEKVMPGDYSHPMDISAASMKFVRSKMRINCSTCHDFHRPFPLHEDPGDPGVKHAKFLRFSSKGPEGVCIDCHPRYALLEGTDHDLRVTAPEFRNDYGLGPADGGLCSPCHGAHNATHKKNLWAAPLGPSVQGDWIRENASQDDMMTRLCTGCHAPGGVAEKQVPQLGLHPKGFRVPDTELIAKDSALTFAKVKDEFPIFTHTGDVADSGNIVCATCHNPHQWNPDLMEKGPGKKDVEGDATNSFLRANLHSAFCSECHGKDSLIKFKYFHSKTSRQEKEGLFSFED